MKKLKTKKGNKSLQCGQYAEGEYFCVFDVSQPSIKLGDYRAYRCKCGDMLGIKRDDFGRENVRDRLEEISKLSAKYVGIIDKTINGDWIWDGFHDF